MRATCLLCPERRGTPDKKLSFSYDPVRAVWHCFRCEARGRGSPPFPLDLSVWSWPGPSLAEGDLPSECRPAILSSQARRYLLRRGLRLSEVRQNRLLFARTGRYASRVIFSDASPDGRPPRVWFQGRAILSHMEPKYLGAPWPKGGVVFRSRRLKRAIGGGYKVPVVIVAEGPFDALMAGRYLPSLAVFGKAPTDAQLVTITHLARAVVVIFDADAWAEAYETARRLRYTIPVKVLCAEGEYKDLDEMEQAGQLRGFLGGVSSGLC